MNERLFLLDGMALAYRAYFAFIANPLRNSRGENTSAVYGFINTLLKIVQEEKPDYVAAVFDTPEPTFRHRAYTAYKATREKMPEDMIPQLPALKAIAEAFGTPVIELPGYEADDIMGTLAVRAQAAGMQTFLVTGDKDFMQLVGRGITMYNPMKKGADKELLDVPGVHAKWGIRPDQVPDVLGLMGDTADNIPGVHGVGEKTAIKLIQEHGSIKKLYDHLEAVKGKLKERLAADRDNAFLSRTLATIDTDVPIRTEIASLRRRDMDADALAPLLRDLEFHALIEKLGLTAAETAPKASGEETANHYHVIRSAEALPALVAKLKRSGSFALTVHPEDADPMQADLAGLCLATAPHEAYYVPIGDDLDLTSVVAAFRGVLEDASVKKYGQNIKSAMLFLRRNGIVLRGVDFDVLIAAHVTNSESSVHLDGLASRYLKTSAAELAGDDAGAVKDRGAAVTDAAVCARTDLSVRLRPLLDREVKEAKADGLLTTIEFPLIRVLADMEFHGVWLNQSILADMSRQFAEEIRKLEGSIFREAGEQFNMNSPQQLGEVLFERLQIHKLAGIEKPKRTGKTGQYATDVKILEQYRSLPIIESILGYRQLTKLKSTYIDGLPPMINPSTGRIHSTFSQTVAATGRLSSSNPNFQNIPIRTDLGREIRRAFCPQHVGWVLLAADYSQIELRVMAHMSGDKNLIEAFVQDADIHASTAMRVFHVTKDNITSELRRKAKDINFGIMYGISPFGLAGRIGMSQSEAKEFIANYFATFPKVKDFIDKTIADGRENAYVSTLFGRRRYLPDLRSKNYTVRQMAERAATNTPIQGTAAELIKLAMISVHSDIEQNGLRSKMVLQVHDELVFEAPQEELSDLKAIVIDRMSHAAQLKVPLKVDTGVGQNWLETK